MHVVRFCNHRKKHLRSTTLANCFIWIIIIIIINNPNVYILISASPQIAKHSIDAENVLVFMHAYAMLILLILYAICTHISGNIKKIHLLKNKRTKKKWEEKIHIHIEPFQATNEFIPHQKSAPRKWIACQPPYL